MVYWGYHMKNKTNVKFIFLLSLSCFILILVSILFFMIGKFVIYDDLPIVADKEPFSVVILDAGHGGLDGGASIGNVYEKELNLDIVMKIKDFLSLYNVDVRLTRSEDKLIADFDSKHKKRDDLLNRVKFARTFNSPIFVSVHMNKFSEEKYSGLQVFFSKNNPYSESLALLLQDNTKNFLQPSNNRKIKKAGSSIYLLDRLECPSILIECGFLSNKEELKKLTDENYQNKLAFVIANSIIEFLNL